MGAISQVVFPEYAKENREQETTVDNNKEKKEG